MTILTCEYQSGDVFRPQTFANILLERISIYSETIPM